MKIDFSIEIQNIIDFLTFEAKRFGVKVYFVGGLVRDLIMDKTINDIDILVEGSAIDFVQNLKGRVEILSVHKDFNTVKTKIDGIEIDFASTRKEIYPYSGCLPVVTQVGCEIKEDLIRRDFTVNAIALELGENKIIDIFNGQKDINECKLRVLHQKSYIDDPTRILRGLDFKLRFDFKFSFEDEKLIKDYLENPNRSNLSVDRVYLTLKKLFCDNLRAKYAFREFFNNKYYKILFDEFSIEPSQIEQAIEIFKPQNPKDVYLDCILEPKKDIMPLNTKLEVYNYFKNLSLEHICSYYAKTQDENALLFYNELKDTKIFLTGANLIEMGYQEGKIIGEILRTLLEEKLAKNLVTLTLEEEKNWVKKHYTLV